jgi:U5 small nuclear ribonucleoprotein component
MKNPKTIRNICVAGHFHHGKTLLIDLLLQQAHVRKPQWNLEKNYRWLDTRLDEQERELSIKATPITLLLPDFNEKHHVINLIDTPGHPNFLGEFVAAMRLADSVLLVIDATEGVMLMTEKIIRHCIREKMKVVIAINKIDRLIIESRIPPEDAYLKLKHTLEEVNTLFRKYCAQFGFDEKSYQFSPSLNNVIFTSA